jgi:predicted nucleic acid-binding Zn finger protein
MIGANNDTSLEGNSYCACSSFQYTILCFHVFHLIATPYELRVCNLTLPQAPYQLAV